MLPYVTAAEVVKICQELMAGGSKPESKNKYPVLNYTLDEIKQYAGVPSEEVPEEVVASIDDCVLPTFQERCSSYVEFNTKDNYTFKGVIVFGRKYPQTGDLPVDEIKFNCYEDVTEEGDVIATTIFYWVRYDAETGDPVIEFDGIASK